jgi:hypothetical protein
LNALLLALLWLPHDPPGMDSRIAVEKHTGYWTLHT